MSKVIALAVLALTTTDVAVAKESLEKSNKSTKTLKIINAQNDSASGPVQTFTGKVRVTAVLTSEDAASISCASVAFEPGARSAWHSHPKGQLLVVTEGAGLIQAEGQPARRIKVGDTIWTPPNVKHWHGATPTSAMVHTATQEIVNGNPVTWMEKVTDAEYSTASEQ